MIKVNQFNPCWPGFIKFFLFINFLRSRTKDFFISFFLHLKPYTLHRIPITVLFVLLSLTPVHADDFFAVKSRVISDSQFKLGFLYFTPLLLLENVGYTSSIYIYDAQDTPDWTGDLGLGLRASAIVANRMILQAEDVPYYSFYLDHKELRTWSNRFGAAAYSYIGLLNFKAGFKRNDLYQRPQLEFSRPFHYIGSEWSGAVDFGRHDNLFLTAYLGFNRLAYDQDPYLGSYNLAESLDHRENIFGLRLNKRIFTSTTIYADYGWTGYRFASRGERDANAQTMALGVDFPAIGALQGRFQIGVKRFDPANPLFRPVERANGRGDVHLTLMERLRFSAFYGLDTYFSYGGSDLFFDNRSFGGGVEIFMTSFLKGGASYQDGRLEYRSFLDLALQRSDRVREQRYYLAIPFLGSTSLGFAYNVYHLTSDALGLDYIRNFWGGFISYEF